MSSLPTAFLSHGSPSLALKTETWTGALREWARDLHPRAVLVVSSQWRTPLPTFSGARRPGTSREGLQDLAGLPTYDPPGHPGLALTALALLADADIKGEVTPKRPLDPGAWIPLQALFPEADMPVVEMSLPIHWRPEDLARLGLALAPLREDGVLILGSGCLVHNPECVQEGDPAPWAVAFDRWMEERLRLGEMAASFAYDREPHASQAVPTLDRLAPLFFAWGAADGGAARSICEGWQHGNVSLRSVTFAA